jgi:hypothetical protein
MELLAFDDEFVAHLAAHGHDDHLGVFLVDAVKDPEVAEPELETGKWVRPKRLDGPAEGRRLIPETSGDAIADDPSFPGREALKLGLGLPSDRDTIRHIMCESMEDARSSSRAPRR